MYENVFLDLIPIAPCLCESNGNGRNRLRLAGVPFANDTCGESHIQTETQTLTEKVIV